MLPDPASPNLRELCEEENEVAWRVDGQEMGLGGEHIGLTPGESAPFPLSCGLGIVGGGGSRGGNGGMRLGMKLTGE